MPRPRRPRTIGAEDYLAHRVRDEMGRRHWTYAMLARDMAEEGVSISASSLQKSFTDHEPDDADNRRPIRVDELVALARVFDTTVEDLLAPRDWVDQEQVDKALADINRADRLIVEAVHTLLDAHIMLARAYANAPADDADQIVDQTTTHGWAASEYLRLVPQAATTRSTPIGTQAVGQRVAALKDTIAAIARDWALIEDARTYLPHRALKHLGLIGSEDWDAQRDADPPTVRQ